MKAARKMLILTLALVLVVSLGLVGCGDKEPKPGSEPGTAKEYLEAGLKELGLSELPTVKYSYNTNNTHQKIAEAVQAMWADQLGVNVEINNMEWNAYLDTLAEGTYQIGRLGWLGDFMDPITFLDMWITGGGNNDAKYSNAEYDKLLADAKATGDQAKRLEYLSKAEKILLKEAGIAPIYFYTEVRVRQDYVKDTVLHGEGSRDYTWASISDAKYNDNLLLNARTEPPSLDSAKATDTTSFEILRHLQEGLTRLDKESEVTKGSGMAADWTVSEDQLTYTFTLKDNVFWTNGDPVTAQDFEFAWKRVLDPETAADYAYQLYPLKNGEKYNAGEATADQVGVTAVDAKTLKVELEAQTPYFLQLTAFGSYYPVNEKVVKANPNWAANAASFVGNGPFAFKSWTHDDKIVVVKNDKYWNKDAVKLNSIQWIMVNDDNTAYQLFQNNEIHEDSAPGELTYELLQSGKATSVPILGTYFFMFNNQDEIFKNANIRKAFSLAIDREAIVNQILKGGQLPATGLVPPGASPDMGVDFREYNGNLLD